jgi:hypothetical protein
MLRGVATDFYPYPFINVRELGFFWVTVNALGVLFAFFVILAVLTAVKVSFRATTSRETAA